MAKKCLELCQTLATRGSNFSFSLKVGTTFTFTLDTTREEVKATRPRKKKSPSSVRRDKRRRDEFKARAAGIQKPDSVTVTAGKTQEDPVSGPSRNAEMYDCIQCDKRFEKKRDLNIHVRSEHERIEQLDGHNESNNSGTNVDENETESQSYQCVECDQLFKEEGDLKKHMKVKHEMGNATDVCVCDVCGQEQKNKVELMIHMGLAH